MQSLRLKLLNEGDVTHKDQVLVQRGHLGLQSDTSQAIMQVCGLCGGSGLNNTRV